MASTSAEITTMLLAVILMMMSVLAASVRRLVFPAPNQHSFEVDGRPTVPALVTGAG